MNIDESKLKKNRLWGLLDSKGLDGVLLNRRSNYAWYTGGGDNHVFLCSEGGAASLLILRDRTYVLAHSMDGLRLMEEQVAGLGYELAQYNWYEGLNSQLDRLVAGKKIGTDTPSDRFTFLNDLDFRSIIFPLTPSEIQMSREIGKSWEDAILDICTELKPGISELEIAGKLMDAFTRRDFTADVLLVGSDDRLQKYRHCLPTEKKVEKHLLIHVAGRKKGLHANVTRLVHFGTVPSDIQSKQDAVNQICAVLFSKLKAGYHYSDLLREIKQAYREAGFDGEWKGHFQGGPNGYEPIYLNLVDDPNAVLQNNETYDWLITLPGAKTEELSLLTEKGVEIISFTNRWPGKKFAIDGKIFTMPDILVI